MKNAYKVIIGLAFVAVIIVFSIIMIAKLSKSDTSLIRTGQIEMREYDVASKIPAELHGLNTTKAILLPPEFLFSK